MNIIIIDDDADDRDLFAQALSELLPSSVCTEFSGCMEALIYLREVTDAPDYIFLDVHMNVIDGKECLLRIKRLQNVRYVPVIMYSGTEYEGEKQIFMKLGADRFFIKPNSYRALCDSLTEFFFKR